MQDSPPSLEKSRLNLNSSWNNARLLSRIRATLDDDTYDLVRLKNFNVDATMPSRLYNRDQANVASENYYNSVDRATYNYAKSNHPFQPYSINALHLQNPYRMSQRLEGYASHDHSKDIHRRQNSSLRWRYNNNNLLIRKESSANRSNDRENEKTGRSKKKKKYKACAEFTELARQYCANSSLHGLRYVGDSELTIVERIFWIITFTSALLTAIYYIVYLYQKWRTAPVIISLSPEPVPLAEFPFPSITICNMNHVKKTEAKRILQGSNTLDQLLLEDICNSDSNVTYDNEEILDWDKMMQFMVNVSQPCTDMIHYCVWHGNQTDCEKIFNPTMTDEGFCCKFNSVKKQHLFYHTRDWPLLNITYPFASVDWNAEEGYNSNIPVDAIPWRPFGAGEYYGLTLVLDVDIAEYYCSSTASAGFKMLLHNPVETPKIADFSFAITPGEETRVIVRPRISTASRTLINIPQAKRKCFFTSERKLRYYRTYTQRNCILECEANFTQKMCNCVQYYMPKSSKTQICGKKDEQCATSARRSMEFKLYNEETTSSLNVTETPSCNCWPACFEINYKVELSQSKLLPTIRVNKGYVKKDINYFTQNMAVVHLFFVDSQFTKYVKAELFGFTEFLSSTGGLLGLFMGFSFLSFVEILYFTTMRLYSRWYNQRKQSKPTMLPVHPLDDRRKAIYPFAN